MRTESITYLGRCELCGTEQRVSNSVIRWLNLGRAFPYESIPRCLDHLACRGRVEARGEKWEIDDSPDPEEITQGY